MANVRKERIGEKRMMKCGLQAEVCAYRSATDIDIRFEDGTVVEHQKYTRFRKGTITHPQRRYKPEPKEERLGEKRQMNCGMEAEIIRYRGGRDLDVRFADGTEVLHKSYYAFRNGMIRNPDLPPTAPSGKKGRLGEKRQMNCGMEAEIIAYRKAEDIDVRFEDGSVQEHVRYAAFRKGSLQSRRHMQQKRIGEERQMNCGAIARIIDYRSASDLDLLFPESGSIVKGRTYGQFKSGQIRDPKRPLRDHTGEEGVNRKGERMRVFACRGYNDIDVEFLPGGEKVYARTMQTFREGKIRRPKEKKKEKKGPPENLCRKEERMGQQRKQNCGYTAQICGYRNSRDIDVRFLEDPAVVEHRQYQEFLRGAIDHPKKKHTRIDDLAKERIGEERIMQDGSLARITGYHSSRDVTVLYPESGKVREHVEYRSFQKGTLMAPEVYEGRNRKIEGEVKRAGNGLLMKVIDGARKKKMTIEFEDGTRVTGITNQSFQNGTVAHPGLRYGYAGSKLLERQETFHGFWNRHAFTLKDGTAYYNCRCQRCGQEDVMTPQQMMEHEGRCEGGQL